MASVARRPESLTLRNRTHSTAAPTAPAPTPKPTRPMNSAALVKTCGPVPAKRPWKTSTPTTAPMGSMVVLSHPRTDTSLGPGRAAWRRGATTVGPDTMRIAPSMTADFDGSPRRSDAKNEAPTHVIGTPHERRRRTTRRLWPSSSRKSRSRPPSNRMMATARLTIGEKAPPKIL